MNFVELFCNVERRVVGKVVCSAGETLFAFRIRAGYRPESPEYAALPDTVAEGQAILCPRCGNPLLFRQPASEGELRRGVYAVAGSVRVA